MVFGLAFMFFWYEANTKRDFEKTYSFLKNLPPDLLYDNKDAFNALMNTIPNNFQFNSSKLSKSLKGKKN